MNWILVVYVVSSAASFQTVGPFSEKQSCEGVKSQLTENFPEIKTACVALSTASLQSIAGAKMAAKLPPPVITADSTPKINSKATTVAVPLPKPRPKNIKAVDACLCKETQ